MRILLIGLDGATWKVIDPLMEQGRLPNLTHLVQGGTRATLRSFEPLLSPILWTNIATGKMPEKHGVTRFFHTATNLRTKRLWGILERPDQPVGLWSWPVTWPPRPVEGFVVPSLFARADDTYPPQLRFAKELETGMNRGWGNRAQLVIKAMQHGLRPATIAKTLNYVINEKLGRYNRIDRVIEQRFLKLDIHLDIYLSLVKRYKPFFSSFYLNQTDALAHWCWRYYEPHLFPDVKPQDVEKYGNVIPQTYEKADRAIGRLLDLTHRDTLVVVVSDHGFQAELGEGETFYGRVLGDKLLDVLNLNQVHYVNYRRVVVLELPGRHPDIVERLSQLEVKELGQPFLGVHEDIDGRVTIKLYQKSRYEGMTREQLQDLHVVWPSGETPFLELIQPHYNKRQSGAHHIEGIGIFHGPGVKPGGHVTDGTIVDVVPTVLALLGMPVGRDMDGKVLTGAIAPEFLEKTPICYIDTYDTDLELADSADEEELPPELMNRLRDLGYIE